MSDFAINQLEFPGYSSILGTFSEVSIDGFASGRYQIAVLVNVDFLYTAIAHDLMTSCRYITICMFVAGSPFSQVQILTVQ